MTSSLVFKTINTEPPASWFLDKMKVIFKPFVFSSKNQEKSNIFFCIFIIFSHFMNHKHWTFAPKIYKLINLLNSEKRTRKTAKLCFLVKNQKAFTQFRLMSFFLNPQVLDKNKKLWR